MSWTGRDDRSQCCPSDLGAPKDREKLARLLHSKIVEPDFDPLRRSDFFPPKNGKFSNECGKSDGSSVVRTDGLSDDQIRQMAQAQAERRPGRTQQGALVATCRDLRKIRLDDAAHQQVFIYDDPLEDEPRHAVVRGDERLDRPDQDALREEIRETFRTIVAP